MFQMRGEKTIFLSLREKNEYRIFFRDRQANCQNKIMTSSAIVVTQRGPWSGWTRYCCAIRNKIIVRYRSRVDAGAGTRSQVVATQSGSSTRYEWAE